MEQSNEPTVKQMNWVIARFEGRLFYGKHPIDAYGGDTGNALPEMKYHTSWDWLMPVIEKISKVPLLDTGNIHCTDPRDTCHPITFNMPTEDGKQVMFRFKGFSLHTADTLIEAAYAAVYEASEYFNSQSWKQEKEGEV